jgi:hypothetical protein
MRHYDVGAGRSTQPDPIGLAGGLNLYGFAGGDPINFSDPFGLTVTPVDAQSRKLWNDLKRAIRDARKRDDEGVRASGALLAGMVRDLENSTTEFKIDYFAFSASLLARNGGGEEGYCHRGICQIMVASNGAKSGPLAALAHEAGGAWLRMTGGSDHFDSLTGAVMFENAGRRVLGCTNLRPDHEPGTPVTMCR